MRIRVKMFQLSPSKPIEKQSFQPAIYHDINELNSRRWKHSRYIFFIEAPQFALTHQIERRAKYCAEIQGI